MTNFFDRFGKPEHISRNLNLLAILQVGMFFFHAFKTYVPNLNFSKGIGWVQYINMQPAFDYQRNWNKHYNFADNINAYFEQGRVSVSFSSFQEMLNPYTIGFFILDTAKWLIPVFVFIQLAKATTLKNDFKGFSLQGVQYIRQAALPIILIPFFNYCSQWLFVRYLGTQSTFEGFEKYTSAIVIGEPNSWAYYLYASAILLGLAEIFRYGMQLKEETDLTV